MKTDVKRWEVINKLKVSGEKEIVGSLLKNRKLITIKEQNDFFNPVDPTEISLKSLGIKDTEVKKAIGRIKKAKKLNEQVIVYGDYDADGITATAIMWEALHAFGLEVLPHIPDRFEEGYGINTKSIENLKSKISNLKLIVTVDNGIVGYDGIKKANELGIDVIVIDHHTPSSTKTLWGKTGLGSYATIHSTKICGSALAWFFSRELLGNRQDESSLELAAIGTVADQMPLLNVNRSIVKYGLVKLNITRRPGVRAILESSKSDNVGTYEINYIIAPRINAMGRLAQGIDSLRLLCTTKLSRAKELSDLLNKTNLERQKIVDQVVLHALKEVKDKPVPSVIVMASENYHEGVIGLAAGKLSEEFYRPAIVFSKKDDISKASARSIPGFNIIEAIRNVDLHLEGGGHPMAAGFSIETKKIETFTKEINKYAKKLLTDELLQKKLRIDLELNFINIDAELVNKLKEFEPTGLGNPNPTFVSRGVEVLDTKAVGRDSKHLKLTLRQNGQVFDSIFFGGGEKYSKLIRGSKIDVVYSIEENVWNGNISIQLKIKDIK